MRVDTAALDQDQIDGKIFFYSPLVTKHPGKS